MKNDEFTSKLKSIVLPMVLQAFMLALVSATDALMLGLVDQTSLSAVSLGGQVQFVLNLYILGITGGFSIMAAQYWGKKDIDTIENIIPIPLRLNLIGGGLFTIVCFLFPEWVMSLFTNVPELIVSGASYLKAVSLSYVLCALSQVFLTILKNSDKSSTASKISSFAVVFNIIANALLIFGLFGMPRLGIVGAAIATVLSRAIELVWSVYAVQKKDSEVKARFSKLFNKAGILGKDYVKYCSPLMAAGMVWGIAFTLYSVIMGHMGSDAVAANSITSIAKALISCVSRGLGNGASIMIGNVLGSGDMEKAKQYASRLTKLSICVGVITGLSLMAISPLIVKIAPLTETASKYLQGMLIFCGVNIMFQSPNHTVLDGIFTSGGDAKFDMYGNIGAMWCFTVPLGLLAAFVFKAPVLVVYCIVNMDEIVKIPAVYLHYKKYVWLKDITR